MGKAWKQKWQKIDTTKGQFFNLSQLVIDEGGWEDKEAVDGSIRLVSKNMLMGSPFTFIHPQTERRMYLRMDFGWEETLTQAWSMFREEFDKGVLEYTTVSQPAGGTVSQPAGATVAGSEPAAKARKPQKPKTEFDKLLAKVNVIRKEISDASNNAVQVLDSVTSKEKKWLFANNPENVGVLKEIMEKMRIALGDSGRAILLTDMATLKKNVAKEQLLVDMKGFIKTKALGKQLEEFTKTLVRRANA